MAKTPRKSRAQRGADYVAATQMLRAPGRCLDDAEMATLRSDLSGQGYVSLAVPAEKFADAGPPAGVFRAKETCLENDRGDGLFREILERRPPVDEYTREPLQLRSSIFRYLLNAEPVRDQRLWARLR